MITIKRKVSSSKIMFAVCSALTIIPIVCYPAYGIEYAQSALKNCGRNIIPSVFPFMIISQLIAGSALSEYIGKLVNKPLHNIFGISGVSGCAVALGSVCGFPIGTKVTVSLTEKGLISRNEAKRLLTICNNPSAAYLINAIGIMLFSSKKAGIALFLITISSTLIIGIFEKLIFGNVSTDQTYNCIRIKSSAITQFTGTVASSAQSMLTVCAYIVFFTVFTGCLGCFMRDIHCPEIINTVISCFTELSSGVYSASLMVNRQLALCLCAFAAGWSGLSVHFQIISLCTALNIRFSGYFLAKFITGLLNAIIICIVYKTNPRFFEAENKSIAAWYSIDSIRFYKKIILILFMISFMIFIIGKHTKRQLKSYIDNSDKIQKGD